jgi:hypothetical protein
VSTTDAPRPAQLPVPRLVLALDELGNWMAIGPVITDRSIEDLRGRAERRGWTVAGVVRHLSRANFIALSADTDASTEWKAGSAHADR